MDLNERMTLKVGEEVRVELSNFGHKSQGFDATIVGKYPSFAKVKDDKGMIRSISYSYITKKPVTPSTSPAPTVTT
ncbi:MAG: hypothetical protein NTY61_01715 [Candidatus Parcubacteria bacterium]|nr:hypothetical protein [Candidatus Parcubacteria bacterium]